VTANAVERKLGWLRCFGELTVEFALLPEIEAGSFRRHRRWDFQGGERPRSAMQAFAHRQVSAL